MSAITATDLTKRYGRTSAVDTISFNIEQGEIVGFLGPNGAGKTTTLRMLAGLIHPTSGSARILGERVPGPNLREVGTMIEEPSFYPYMSGRDNLRYASLLHGDVGRRRIDEVLTFVSMENAGNKRVGAYSQGMRQRLGLARALLWRPKILLLDEPTNGLDPVGIAEIRENLRLIASQGTTILISSHILAELEKIVERVLVIEKGKLLFDGPVKHLTKRLDQAEVIYWLEATDMLKLHETLTGFGYGFSDSDGQMRVAIPAAEAPKLLARLVNCGLEVIEARREVENLEGAYLRLLREDGRPS